MSKSLAVNLKSFVDTIVSRCRYTTGTDLETRHKQQLFNYLVGKSISLLKNVINIKTAINILKKFYELVDYENYFNAIDFDIAAKDSMRVLSSNTAKALLNRVLPMDSIMLTRFSSPTRIFEFFDGVSAPNYFKKGYIKFKIPYETNTTFNLNGTLYGGGGGGSGGAAVDGNKDSKYKWNTGAGANGNESLIRVITETETTVLASAAGGAGGAKKSGTVGENPNGAASGNDGANGEEVPISLVIPTNTVIQICIGAGGGGGGGIGVSASTSSTYSATAGGYTNGGAGKEANSFTGDDHVAGGGGGSGGWGYWSDLDLENNPDTMPAGKKGATYSSGPKNGGTVYEATTGETSFGNKARGGKGGYISGVGENSTKYSQPSITSIKRYAGVGGRGGSAKNSVDVWTCANGGDGGNAGGLFISHDDSDKNNVSNYLICGLVE